MNWYIVHAYSGFEKKVVESLKEELKKNKLSERQIKKRKRLVKHIKKSKK